MRLDRSVQLASSELSIVMDPGEPNSGSVSWEEVGDNGDESELLSSRLVDGSHFDEPTSRPSGHFPQVSIAHTLHIRDQTYIASCLKCIGLFWVRPDISVTGEICTKMSQRLPGQHSMSVGWSIEELPMHWLQFPDHLRGRQEIFNHGVGRQRVHAWIPGPRNKMHMRQLQGIIPSQLHIFIAKSTQTGLSHTSCAGSPPAGSFILGELNALQLAESNKI
jgi:hypothetical protein